MRVKNTKRFGTLEFLMPVILFFAICLPRASVAATAYPDMAPLNRYLMPKEPEITLARSAAPRAISDGATVMVLGREGYITAVKGTNGFLCMVQRSWGSVITDPGFWNPQIRGPICFNPPAVRTFVPIYLLKTKLVLAGKSKSEIVQALALAFNEKKLPALKPGAMCYMLSKEQHIGDQAIRWYPHLMFFVSGDATKSWGANLLGSPMLAVYYPDDRATILMVVVDHWSDGSPTPRAEH